jgi:nitrite reductase (cytochrome c-552)
MRLLRGRTLGFVGIVVAVGFATAAVTALLININQRKQEEKNPYLKLVEVDENTVDAQKWGMNFPRQYDGYRRTGEPSRTKYGGGAPSEASLPPEKAARDPWLTRLFAGYAFSIDYRDRRGHAHMLEDQEGTRRTNERKQSGNCLHCHASVMPMYRALGKEAAPQASTDEQVQKGLEIVGVMDYWEANKKLKDMNLHHPVGCVDCHDPKTMELRVTRPAFITGIKALKAHEGVKDYEPNRDATRQEMRSFVCAQCHVEYYCGSGTTLFFPWAKGLKVEQIQAEYDSRQLKGHRFYDWVHAETGAKVLKAQHPEFEVWSQGIHARSGVACADCHMPYSRQGAMKVSEHWVKSPLLSINRSCQTCHHYPESEIQARVEVIQDRHYALMQRAGAAIVDLIDAVQPLRRPYDERNRAAAEAKAREALAQDVTYAKLPMATQAERLAAEVQVNLTTLWSEEIEKDKALGEIAELQRGAQWRLDFVAAENSMGFHAPQELARILGESIDLSRQGVAKAMAYQAGAKVAAETGASPAPWSTSSMASRTSGR